MTDTTPEAAAVTDRPLATCPYCEETVPQASFCIACGRQIGQLDLSKIFTSSERAAGYAEVDQRAPMARAIGAEERGDDAVLEEPEVEREEPAGEPDARPTLRVLFGGLFGRKTEPADAGTVSVADDDAVAESTDENPSMRTLFRSWFKPTAASATDTSDTAKEGTAEPVSDGAAAPMWMRPRFAALAVGVPVLLVGGLIVGLAVMPNGQTPAPAAEHVATSSTTLPGWAKEQTWSKGAAVGTVGVTSDGNYVGYAHGNTVTVLHAGSGRTATTMTLPGKAVGGVSAVTVDGKPALAAASKTAVTVWGAGKLQLEAGIPSGGKFQVRAGVPFVVTDSTASMLTGHGAVPVTFPRPGALIMGGTTNGQVLWASARGEVLTAATNGTITGTAKLDTPKGGTGISSWVVATGDTVWVRWKTDDKGTVLAAHSVRDGKVVSTTDTSSDEPIATSQDGKNLLVQGAAFTAAGKRVDVPKGFIADGFVGNHLYGADQDGKTAYVDADTIRTGPAPTVIPVAETAAGGLIAVTNGRISTYPAADHTTKQ